MTQESHQIAQGHFRGKPRRGQTLVEFALTLPILLLLMFGIIEFGRIFQAWVTIQNAARTAIRYAVTGQYDASMFTLDNDWDPATVATSHPGIPCAYVDTDPKQVQFKNHWDDIACNPGNDDHYWMRRDVVRLYTIYQTAKIGAAGLALNGNPPDIPGTCQANSSGACIANTGFGKQLRSELLTKLRTERGWFHVWMCSTRVTLQDTDVSGKPYARYTQGDEGADKLESDLTKFGQCQVQEAQIPDPAGLPGAKKANPNLGKDQYDPGGPGDFFQVVVYFNHPLITPLGLQSNGFITLVARRVAVNESYRTAKVINLADQGSGAASVAPPKLEKSFAASSISMISSTGTNLILRVTNNNAADALTLLTFSDEFPKITAAGPDFDKYAIVGNGPATSSGVACTGVVIKDQAGNTGFDAGDTKIVVTIASIAAGANTCTITVPIRANPTLAAASAGTYLNLTSAITSFNGGAGSPASANIGLSGAAKMDKSFANLQTTANTLNKMTFTLTNDNNADLHAASFTDTFPAGMRISNPVSGFSNGCGGTATYTAGGSSFTYANGMIPANSSCVITIDVIGNAAGLVLTNTVSGVTTTEGGTGTGDTATFQTLNGMQADKTFTPSTTTVGTAVTLAFSITNPNAGTTADNVTLTDTLADISGGELRVDSPNNGLSALTGCGAGTVTAVAGGQSITLNNATITNGTPCTFSLNVEPVAVGGSGNGSYLNTAAVNSSNMGAANTPNRTLVALAAPVVAKSFSVTNIVPGGTATMTITIQNLNTTALNNVTFTDTLPNTPGQMVVAPTPGATNTCTGGTFAPAAGATSVTLTSFSLNANTTCTVSVNVTSNTPGVYNNSVFASSAAGNSNTSTATLIVANAPTIRIGYNTNQTDPSTPALNNGNATIPAGSTTGVPLTIVITNPSTNIGVNLTSIDFTDILPTNVTVLSVATDAKSCGLALRTASTTNGSNLNSTTKFRYRNLSATVLPGQSCYVTVNSVTSNTAGTYNNNIPAAANNNNTAGFSYTMTATATGTSYSGNAASNTAVLTVTSGLAVTKAFNPTSINPGGTSVLTITLTNPNTFAVTGVNFTDTLPNNVTVATVPAASTTCSPGTLVDQSNNAVSTGDTAVKLVNGTIPASGTCTVTFTVTGTVPNNYTNTIPINMVTSVNGGKNGAAANATLSIIGGPVVDKTVSSGTINIGTSTTLTITLTNPNPTTALTNVSFTDTFPPGLVVFTTPGFSNSCGGTITDQAGNTGALTSGDTQINLTGGTIAAGSSCQIRVNVTANAVGTYNNIISNATGNNVVGTPDNVNIVVNSNPPTAAKAFAPSTINPGGQSTLTITITNPNINPQINLTNLSISDPLPANVTLVVPPAVTNTCGGTLTDQTGGALSTGDTRINLTGGTLNAGASPTTCTITVTVTGNVAGAYNNTTGGASSTQSGTGNPSNTATLYIVGPPAISKAFSPTAITIGSYSTLTIRVTNPNPSTALTGVSFSDPLPSSPAQMTVYSTPSFTSSGCGSATFTGNTSGSTTIGMTGGTIAAGGTCTITIRVTGPNIGAYNNTAGAPGSTNGGTGVASTQQTLTVTAPPATIAKVFSVGTINVGGKSTVTLTVTNPNATQALNAVTFSDTLVSGLNFAAPVNIVNGCGGTATTSGKTITLAGGSLAGGATCTLKFDVTSSTAGTYANSATGVDSTESAVGNPSTSVNLIVVGPPTISKAFAQSSIVLGASTKLTITITNPNSAQSLSGVGFTDTFPTTPGQMSVATPLNNKTNSCGGTFNPTAGATSITLSGGTIAANSSCTVTIDVTGSAIGSYSNTAGAPTSTEGGTGVASTPKTLTITGPNPPSVGKSFSPGTITDGQSSTLTLTITSPGSNAGPLTAIALTDSLPSGLKFTATPTTTCGGTITTSGSPATSVTLSGGSISTPGQTCTITGTVTNTSTIVSQQSYHNLTGTVSGTNQGNNLTGGTAAADLIVNPLAQPKAPVLAKGFSRVPMLGTIPEYTFAGFSITLIFTIENQNASPMAGVAFNDPMPAYSDLHHTGTPTYSNCGSATFSSTTSATAGQPPETLRFSTITIPANTTCQIQVTMVSNNPDYANNGGHILFTNTTGTVSSTTAGVPSGSAASGPVQIDTAGGSHGQE